MHIPGRNVLELVARVMVALGRSAATTRHTCVEMVSVVGCVLRVLFLLFIHFFRSVVRVPLSIFTAVSSIQFSLIVIQPRYALTLLYIGCQIVV